MADFDGTDAFFDSLDVIERIAELELLAETMSDEDETEDARAEAYEEYDADEYTALTALQEEAEGYISDWQYGQQFYTFDALVGYTEELVTECGYLSSETPSWITNHIDWEAVTEEIKVDYTEFEFRGTTYYAR